MKKYAYIFLSALLSGFCITIGVCVYLSVVQINKIVGSLLFGLGLFGIVHFNLFLYTGKVGNLLDNKPLDLRHKKQEKKTTKLQHTIAQICGVNDKSVAPKKGMLANVVWCAAKFTVASVVFGPLVGGWLVAHYNNNEYFSKKEAKAFDFVNSFSWGDPFIKGPSADKGKGK